MKHLLYILCLFVLSCDSGGDGNLLNQLVGSWIISSHLVESEGVCEDDPEGDYDYIHNIYVVIDEDRTWLLKDIESDKITISGIFNESNWCFNDPECENYNEEGEEGCSEGAHYTCEWINNSCEWENFDNECFENNIILNPNNDSFTTIFETSNDGCIKIHTRIYQRME